LEAGNKTADFVENVKKITQDTKNAYFQNGLRKPIKIVLKPGGGISPDPDSLQWAKTSGDSRFL